MAGKLTTSEAAIKPSKPIVSKYVPEIDGLRALAVIAVIVNHFNNNILPGGFLGVDIFFVISGYVITQSLASRPQVSMLIALKEFYSRRVKRLFPALVVCVLFSGIIAALFNPEPLDSLRTGVASLFGASNFYLLYNSTNYFGELAELNFFTQTWTLGVEEQFYLIFPLIFLYMVQTSSAQSRQKGFVTLLLVLIVSSAYMFLHYTPSKPGVVFYMMPFRFWELGAGCLLAVIQNNNLITQRYFKKINTELLLVLLIGSLFYR